MPLRRFLAFIFFAASASWSFGQLGDSAAEALQMQKSIVPADQIPPAPALSAEEALKTFKLAPGIRLEIAASDPLIQDPVALKFGPDGRLWVVEMRGYMATLDGKGEEAPVGRISVLTDRDGDGRYDTSTVFLDHLVMPRAIALVADGVVVIAPPQITFWRDTDGDGKGDQALVLASDAGVKIDPLRPMRSNPESQPNSPLWAFDNWIYFASYPKKFRYLDGKWETAPSPLRGQWGLSQDDFGHFYQNSNSDHLRVDVVFGEYLRRNPNYARLEGANVNVAADQYLWPARVTPGINRGYRPEMLRDGRLKAFTAACGPWVYRGNLLPELYGNVFVAEPAAHVVRRTTVTSEGGTIHGRNAYDQAEFIASTDERFRPVSFATGPDGALYIVDLYRGVLQHRIALTSYLRKQAEDRKLDQPQHLGRIYRVVPVGEPPARATRLAPLDDLEWVAKLEHPNSWWRETAQQMLVEHHNPSVIPALREAVRGGMNPLGRVHALWTLQGLAALDLDSVQRALADQSPLVRAAALRAGETLIAGGGRAAFRTKVLSLLRDPVPEVQLQAVLSAGEFREPAVDFEVAGAVRDQPKNLYLADALYSGIADREIVLLEKILKDASWPVSADADRIVAGVTSGVYGARQPEQLAHLLELAVAQLGTASHRSRSLVEGMALAAAAIPRPLKIPSAPPGWAQLRDHPATRERFANVEGLVIWPGKAGAPVETVVIPLSPAQQQRFTSGQTVFVTTCAPCHQPSGRGLDGLAPPLRDSEWVLEEPQRLIKIVLHGLAGTIRVLGQAHAGEMPAFGVMDDHQLSSVLTYIRREWGHEASPIDPADVKAVRAATAGRNDAWSSSELTRGEPRADRKSRTVR